MAESSLEVTRADTNPPDPFSAAPPHTPTWPEQPVTVAPEAGVQSALPAGREYLPQVQGYEIQERIGHGGMGVVYRARHLRLNRLVALKMIRDGLLATEEQLARFYAEARAVAKLQHSHIVQIYEIGEQQGRPYFALELVEGGNLAQKLAVLPLPATEAAQLVRTLARAMHHAHQNGIIHRDLKPANVLLTREGQPRITDFGLAKELEAEVFLTHSRSGLLMGTPSYMAPEQAWGPTRHIGPAADVYGLGAILYEALTGHPPFVASSLVEVLEQVRNQEPLPPSRRHSQCPRDLEVICLKCLRKEPGQRYATAADLADDLDRYLHGETIQARPASIGERGLKWARRHPVALILGAAVLLLGVSAGVAVQYLRQQGEAAAQNKRDQDAARDEFRKDQYPLHLARAEQSVAAGDNRHARQLLEECHPERRGWEWNHLRGLTTGRRPIERRAHIGGVWNLAAHPSAPRLASAGSDGSLRLWELPGLRGGAEFMVRTEKATALTFAPEGDRLAVALYDSPPLAPNVLPPAERKPPAPMEDPGQPDSEGADAASEDQFRQGPHRAAEPPTWFVGRAEAKPPVNPPPGIQQARIEAPSVLVWDLRTRRQLFSLPKQPLPVTAVGFLPDGKYLATATGVFVPVNFPLADPDPWPLHPPAPVPPVAPAAPARPAPQVQREGGEQKTYFVLREDIRNAPGNRGGPPILQRGAPPEPGQLTLWDMDTGKPFRSVALPALILCLAVHPRQPLLAVGCEDGSVRLWDHRTGQVRTLLGHQRRVRSIVFNPAGDVLASAGQDGTVRLWDPARGSERFVLREHSSSVLELAFSPNGERLASAGEDRTVRLWDVERGQQLLALRGHLGAVTCVAFSADGQSLVSGDTQGSLRMWDGSPPKIEDERAVEDVGATVGRPAPPPQMEVEKLPTKEAIPRPTADKEKERPSPPRKKAKK